MTIAGTRPRKSDNAVGADRDHGYPISVNSTTFTEPAGPLGLSAGSAVTLAIPEFRSTDE
jgi:hypothetical protein